MNYCAYSAPPLHWALPLGVSLMTYSMGRAMSVPRQIPPRRTGLIKAPMPPLSFSWTHIGANIMQRDVSQPLVNAKADSLRIFHQSELKSQSGPTSKAVKRIVIRKRPRR